MPIYEYQCQECGARNEALQKMADPPLTTCERCGGALRRLISSPAVQFKGSGWYVTDYARRSGGGKSAGSDGGKGEGTGGESKGEKPAGEGGGSAASGGSAGGSSSTESGTSSSSGGSSAGSGDAKS
jgi:putative FmdB family regulatory protein